MLQYRRLAGYRYQVMGQVEIPFKNGAFWTLPNPVNHPFFMILPDRVIAKSAYAWDGATFAINTKNLIVPSLIHDIGCQAVNLGLLPRKYRAEFDLEYFLQAEAYGVCMPRAAFHFAVIRLWGMIPKRERGIAPYAKVYSVRVR